MTKAYLEPFYRPKMAYFVKIVDDLETLTVFAKYAILEGWQGSKYASR